MVAPPAARDMVRRAGSPRILLDVAVGVALAAVVLIAVTSGRPGSGGRPGTDGRPLRTSDVVIAGAVFVLVAVRRWRPPVVLAVSATLAVAVAGSENLSGPFIMATAVATYTVATRTDRRHRLAHLRRCRSRHLRGDRRPVGGGLVRAGARRDRLDRHDHRGRRRHPHPPGWPGTPCAPGRTRPRRPWCTSATRR